MPRRVRSDELFREPWKERAAPELRARVDDRLRAEQASGAVRDDLTIEQSGRFVGLVLDGLVVQRGFDFDVPEPDVVVHLIDDAIRGRARRRTRDDRRRSA